MINNDNIRQRVNTYLTDKNSLPQNMQTIGNWDVSNVTDMSQLFMPKDNDSPDLRKKKKQFNESLNGWDVSNVVNMKQMFSGCTNFNNGEENTRGRNRGSNPLRWDVSKVTDMEEMFGACEYFNQPLQNIDGSGHWDVSKVKNMKRMFWSCSKFNQPLHWDVSKVENMSELFNSCMKFNSDLRNANNNGPWNVSKVTDMAWMFAWCEIFDKPLEWDVSKVTDMECMFLGCGRFNQQLKWDVSNVKNMKEMFNACYNFNNGYQSVAIRDANGNVVRDENGGVILVNEPMNWDVSNLIPDRDHMSLIFYNCDIFNVGLHCSYWLLQNPALARNGAFTEDQLNELREYNVEKKYNFDKYALTMQTLAKQRKLEDLHYEKQEKINKEIEERRPGSPKSPRKTRNIRRSNANDIQNAWLNTLGDVNIKEYLGGGKKRRKSQRRKSQRKNK